MRVPAEPKKRRDGARARTGLCLESTPLLNLPLYEPVMPFCLNMSGFFFFFFKLGALNMPMQTKRDLIQLNRTLLTGFYFWI